MSHNFNLGIKPINKAFRWRHIYEELARVGWRYDNFCDRIEVVVSGFDKEDWFEAIGPKVGLPGAYTFFFQPNEIYEVMSFCDRCQKEAVNLKEPAVHIERVSFSVALQSPDDSDVYCSIRCASLAEGVTEVWCSSYSSRRELPWLGRQCDYTWYAQRLFPAVIKVCGGIAAVNWHEDE